MTNKQLEMHVNSKYNSVMTQESICLLCHCRIKENTLFTDLTDEQLKLFQDFVVTSFYKKRDVIFIEGDACPGFYVVKNGRVKLIKTSRDGKEQIIIALSKELDHAYSKIGSMGLMNAREKMAHLLNTLANEYGVKDNTRVKLNLSLSRLEIAELLGITQETAIRLLKSFKDEGIIEIKRKEIIIKSPAKLELLGK